MKSPHSNHSQHDAPDSYVRLAGMVLLSFAAMYMLMYAMVDRLDDVYFQLNEFYMAGLMAAPMLVIELALMRSMYPNRKWNSVLLALGIGLTGLFWVLIRQQAAIDDRQFLRSMIPHHGGAILMCGRLQSRDPRLQALCANIISSQQREIAEMKAMLNNGR